MWCLIILNKLRNILKFIIKNIFVWYYFDVSITFHYNVLQINVLIILKQFNEVRHGGRFKLREVMPPQ